MKTNDSLAVAADQPMTAEEVLRIPARKARVEPPLVKIAQDENLPADDPEKVPLGTRVFPAGSRSIAVERLTQQEVLALSKPLETTGYIPEFADFNPKVKLEPKRDAKPKFIDREEFMGGTVGVETIFSPDQRQVFNDTNYPWRCSGRVDSPLGFASGVMVGPRHLLTCSHIVDWQANNSTGWLSFKPAFYNGSTPFGTAWASLTYYKQKVTGGDGINSTELQYDYVVIVLNSRIGDQTGWLGSKSYTDSWDGGAYWAHVGYPGDLTGGQRPTYQGSIALDGANNLGDAHQYLNHRGDIWPGQSGGSFFGYWNGAPHTVCVQSAHNPSTNFASGGSDMVDLIIRARNEHP
ncbi:trypsin-like serine peptidase [Spirosoma soli]|uniref:Trypsin-like serine peptidase n=1 Tax=Spirosoma soli TaxID=1770529 RepID=A0ABW5M6X0_9BACT